MAERKSFLLRMSPELYAALENWSADELRSVNAQIEFLLIEAVRKAGRGRWLKKPGREPLQQVVAHTGGGPVGDAQEGTSA